MKIERVTIRHMQMELKMPFTTSFGTLKKRDFLLLEAVDADGVVGWAETTSFPSPWYNEESLKTNWHMLEDYLLPLVLQEEIEHPDQVSERFAFIRRNYMAKAAIEGAVWDVYARKQGVSLSQAIGGEKREIEVGVSIGIQPSVADTLRIVEKYVTSGYRRIKVKVKPGWDLDVLREIRREFPTVPLMADANSAYTLDDLEHLQKLDEFDLMMVEQPLASDDIIDHAKLQARLSTPVCLDESIHSVEDVRKALELGSCKIINIKVGRVGGLTEAKRIHDFCQAQGIPVWCGGMLESGVGRAHNIALTTLGNFTLPGDTAASSHYWERDIIDPEVEVHNGLIHVPTTPGIGYEVNRAQVDAFTVSSKTYRA
ncbi:MAG: o-succinylbenzoate synthase [Tumebacillaceae bacterium]